MGRHNRLEEQPELRALVLKKRGEGLTFDALAELCRQWYDAEAVSGPPPSRSAIGRYLHRVDVNAAKIRETREAARALSAALGTEADSESVFEAITEIVSGELFELLIQSKNGELTLADLGKLATVLSRMQTAREKSAGFRVKELQRQREQAASAARRKAKQAGLSDAVADGIFRAVVGATEPELPEDSHDLVPTD